MKIEYKKCDCCQKVGVTVKLFLPIRAYTDTGVTLDAHVLSICEKCATAISETYYDIAENNGSTGFRAIYTG